MHIGGGSVSVILVILIFTGVHCLKIVAAGFLVFMIGVFFLKFVIFALLFKLSEGRLKLWIFPNLTKDVGFRESFWPIYDYTYTGASKKKKDKDSDDEESDDEEDVHNAAEDEKNDEADQSESDDSTSKKSSVAGKDLCGVHGISENPAPMKSVQTGK